MKKILVCILIIVCIFIGIMQIYKKNQNTNALREKIYSLDVNHNEKAQNTAYKILKKQGKTII